MRPDLPWSVAGISSEAREAARAAARREGLSVGEWLTRRIVSGLSDMSEPTRSEWSSRAEARPQPERTRFASDAMLEHVSRSETETAETYRRIEDQLRSLGRRLDASERSQTENSRVMSKAAVEMNIATREQAQAFDQLGAHVTHLAERLEAIEGRDPDEGMKDAVKALHQGLSRLADQISQTANHSAAQISNLANNLETVAGRVSQARQDATAANQALEARLAALDERVRTIEASVHGHSAAIDQALQAIDAQKRQPSPMEAISRLEENVRRIEERGLDPAIDRRLSGIERSVADVRDHVEQRDETTSSLEDHLRRVIVRLDTLEDTQRSAIAEARMTAAPSKTAEIPPAPPVEPVPAASQPPFAQPTQNPTNSGAANSGPASFSAMDSFEPPPFATEAPPFVASTSAAPSFATAPAFAPAAPFGDPLANPYELPPDPGLPPMSSVTADAALAAEAPSSVESFLAAARRSAREAALQEAERAGSIGGLRWGAQTKTEDTPKQPARPFIVGLVALIGIFIVAAVLLSRMAMNPTPSQPAVEPTPMAKHAPAPSEGQAEPLPPTPQAAEQTNAPQAIRTAAPQQALPAPTANKPAPAQAALPPQASIPTNAPLDRLTQAANAGNARAQLLVGLKYLESIPANEGEAAKWLTKAADAGEPVAQYRLGKLYERGKGVATDPVKAVRLYLAAANQGSRKAMHDLAVSYAEAIGVKRDYAEASRWFQKAANLGLIDSQFNLAVLYERGLGVPQNLVDAFKWYAIAAAQGDAESKARIGTIASQLNPEARAAAQHAADSFRPGPLNARANVAPSIADATRG